MPLFVPGRPNVLQPCRSAHTPSTVRVRILETSPATHTHGPVLRRNAHGGWRRHLRGARTHGNTERTERVRMHVPRHARHGGADTVLHPLAAGSVSTRRGPTGVRPSCALGGGAGTRGPRRLGYGTRTAVGAMVRLPHYSQGTRRVLAGYSRARALNDLRGAVKRAVRGTRIGDSQSTSTRGGTANDTDYPTALGHCRGAAASVLTATCGEGTRTSVRRCVRAHAAVLTDTNGPGLARRRTARHRARGGAQESQQVERRQRVRDRAVELVRGERPATGMVRPAVP